ncbi:rRNA maturation RNase YbeY [Robiginitalea sp. IMCC44478]|uniref:rRNA maturation RNase YbeY n=1 Tax=Robiginitalea sp. IMCC44478 TaxID=3459122 RepID=UPI0040432152
MIEFFYETTVEVDELKYTDWIIGCVGAYGKSIDYLNYIFCDDEYLLEKNKQYLSHDYYTDILTFPYESQKGIAGDIFISVDRVKENSNLYNSSSKEELRRVMIHGVLHLMGFGDKSKNEREEMRKEEDACLILFHVKH